MACYSYILPRSFGALGVKKQRLQMKQDEDPNSATSSGTSCSSGGAPVTSKWSGCFCTSSEKALGLRFLLPCLGSNSLKTKGTTNDKQRTVILATKLRETFASSNKFRQLAPGSSSRSMDHSGRFSYCNCGSLPVVPMGNG